MRMQTNEDIEDRGVNFTAASNNVGSIYHYVLGKNVIPPPRRNHVARDGILTGAPENDGIEIAR